VIGGDDQTILWDGTTGKELRRLGIDAESVAVTPDGRTALFTSGHQAVTVWDLVAGKKGALRSHISEVELIAVSADGEIAASADVFGSLFLWKVGSNKPPIPLHRDTRPRELVSHIALSPDGRVFAAFGERVRLWDARRGLPLPVSKEFPSFGRRVTPGRPYGVAAFSACSRLLATAAADGDVRVWEVATGHMVARFSGHSGRVQALMFSGDGKTLVSGGADGTALLWAVDAVGRDGPRPEKLLAPETLSEYLGSPDARRAYRAIFDLVAAPEQAVPFLAQLLRPQKPPDADTVRRWIAALDSDSFLERERATNTLKLHGKHVERALRQALTGKPTLELQRRIEDILKSLEDPSASAELLRGLRAIVVLERINTPTARRVLANLARDARETPVGAEARQMLERLTPLPAPEQ
jgi:hypothetical protein